MNIFQDDHSLYEYQVSGRNPDPVCIPIPYMPLFTDMCIRLFNIFTPGRNLHVCMDWLTRVLNRPVVVLHFDCMRMGADGVALVKPWQDGGLPEQPQQTQQQNQPPQTLPQMDTEVFDSVTETREVL